MEGTGIQAHVNNKSCVESCALHCRHASVGERPSRVEQSEALWQRQMSAPGQGGASEQTTNAGTTQLPRASQLNRWQVACAHLHRLISAADVGHSDGDTNSCSIARRNPRLVSFLAGMLCLDPEERLTPLKALVHPFFGEVFPFAVPLAAAADVLKPVPSSTTTSGLARATSVRHASAGAVVPIPRGLPVPVMAGETGNIAIPQHYFSTLGNLTHQTMARKWVEGHGVLGMEAPGDPTTPAHPPKPAETSQISCTASQVGVTHRESAVMYQNSERCTLTRPSGAAVAPSFAAQADRCASIPALHRGPLHSAVPSPAFSPGPSHLTGTLVASVCPSRSPYDEGGRPCGPRSLLLHADREHLTREPKLRAGVGAIETTRCTKNITAANVPSKRRNRFLSAANVAALTPGLALTNEDSRLNARRTPRPQNGKQTDHEPSPPLESTCASLCRPSTDQVHDAPIPSPPAASFSGRATRPDPRQRNRFLTPAVLAKLNPDVAERIMATAEVPTQGAKAIVGVASVTKEHEGRAFKNITRAKRSLEAACANYDLQGPNTGGASATTPRQTRGELQTSRAEGSNCRRKRPREGESTKDRCGDGDVLLPPTATPHEATTAASCVSRQDDSRRRPKRSCVGEPIYSGVELAKESHVSRKRGGERRPTTSFDGDSTNSDAELATESHGTVTTARRSTTPRRAAVISAATTRRMLDESEFPQR